MTIEIRETRPDDYRAAATAMATALLSAAPGDEAWERALPSWAEMASLSAWDGDRCVGHAGEFPVATTVPGGARLPTGAVTRVGVLPTHRRLGVATGLIHRLVDDSAGRGNVLMSLRASEAVIYARYGFGVAGEKCRVEIRPDRARPVAGGATPGRCRLLAPDEILDVVPPVYDRVAHRRPGVVTRPDSWWRRYLRDAYEQTKAAFVVVHADAEGQPDGYAHYEVRWSDGMAAGSTGVGAIIDLFGADDDVELALWSYLFDLDLVTRWTADERPLDDAIRVAAHDRRAIAITSVADEQWLRLLDVDVALEARTYAATTATVAIHVDDPLCAANRGTWRVTADGARQTDDEPDLVVPIGTLSAAYLGGTSWHVLAAGRALRVVRAGAVADADLLFAGRPLPFCGSFF